MEAVPPIAAAHTAEGVSPPRSGDPCVYSLVPCKSAPRICCRRARVPGFGCVCPLLSACFFGGIWGHPPFCLSLYQAVFRFSSAGAALSSFCCAILIVICFAFFIVFLILVIQRAKIFFVKFFLFFLCHSAQISPLLFRLCGIPMRSGPQKFPDGGASIGELMRTFGGPNRAIRRA